MKGIVPEGQGSEGHGSWRAKFRTPGEIQCIVETKRLKIIVKSVWILLEQVFMSARMSSLCGVGVRMNNFSSKTTRPRDMLFLKKKTKKKRNHIYRGWKIVQGMHICLFICLLEPLQVRYSHPKCEHFNTLSQFSHWLLQGFISYLVYMY